MNGTASVLTKSDFINESQRFSDELYYNHIDMVLAFQSTSVVASVTEQFLRHARMVKTVECVGQINESAYVVYLCVPEGGQNYARTIQKSIKALFQAVKQADKQAYRFIISSKIGISVIGKDSINFQTAVTHAFQATMAQSDAKQAQRISFFDTALQLDIKRQLILEDVVQVAVDNDDVNVVYQPIVSTKTWAIEGYEVLSRFNTDPILKVQTRELIAVCEDLNLISELDLLTYHKALNEFKPYINKTDAFLNINLSTNTRQRFDELIDCVSLLTTQNKLDHSRLIIDINPTREHFDTALSQCFEHLTRLKDKGTAFALADLSPGFDLGNQLVKGHFKYLRLDDRFRFKFRDESGYYQIMKLLVKVCHDLDIKIIVEGVVTLEQARLLLFLGVDYLQGDLFTLPATIAELSKLPERINRAVDKIFTQANDSNSDASDLFMANVGSIASRSLPQLDPSSTVSLANQYFKTQSVSILPVLDGKECVGVVERHRLNLFLTPTMGTHLETDKETRMWNRPINAVMEVKFNSVDASLDIESMLVLLREKVYQLPLVVTTQGVYSGILTSRDLISYLLRSDS
jgi:EAL domain-containing protein (putative c-di-GMP-specific phosphodiesterase class I)/predicted transcriptional regulator